MSQDLPSPTSTLGLRGVRSGFITSASSQSTGLARSSGAASVSATTGHELPRLWDETMRRARTTFTSEVSRHRSHSVRRVAAGSARMARRAGR